MRCLFAAALCGTVLAGTIQAGAASALAVGVTDSPSDGIAYGYAYNYGSADEAARIAERDCHDYKSAPKAAVQCHLIGSIAKGCLGIAFDPDPTSSGIGWAVAEDRDSTSRRAIADCESAAPAARKGKCEISFLKCDGDPPVGGR